MRCRWAVWQNARLIHFFSLTLSVVDRNIHGTTKLVSYFAVLNYCLLSRTEKEMVCWLLLFILDSFALISKIIFLYVQSLCINTIKSWVTILGTFIDFIKGTLDSSAIITSFEIYQKAWFMCRVVRLLVEPIAFLTFLLPSPSPSPSPSPL